MNLEELREWVAESGLEQSDVYWLCDGDVDRSQISRWFRSLEGAKGPPKSVRWLLFYLSERKVVVDRLKGRIREVLSSQEDAVVWQDVAIRELKKILDEKV